MFAVCSCSSVALADLPTLVALKCLFSSSQWLPHRTGQERLMTDSCSPSSHGYYCDLTDNTTPSIHCLLKELVQRSAIQRPGVSMAMWPIQGRQQRPSLHSSTVRVQKKKGTTFGRHLQFLITKKKTLKMHTLNYNFS